MPTQAFQKIVSSAEELTAILGPPSPLSVRKELAALDEHMISFIAQSPFLLLATAGRDGRCDVSPRGDEPGLARVLDPGTLLLPERAGNRRADSLRNIIDSGRAGLLFVIPGVPETLRVNGRAQVIRDEEALDPLAIGGRTPLVAIAVSIEECFLQCGKALLRSRLWAGRSDAAPAALPSFGQMLLDQTKLEDATVESLDEHIQKSYKALY